MEEFGDAGRGEVDRARAERSTWVGIEVYAVGGGRRGQLVKNVILMELTNIQATS